jgi:hypothetical protein
MIPASRGQLRTLAPLSLPGSGAGSNEVAP